MELIQLSTLYLPVQAELVKVEEGLQSIYREDLKKVPTLLSYPLKVAGKRLRPALTLLTGHSFVYDTERLIHMATSVELFHIATLVHDDIVDKAQLRRGVPTVNQLHGHNIAVLLGDYVFARAAEMVCSTGNLQVVTLFAQTLGIISKGELQQNFSSSESRCQKQHYFEWIGNKTASLFRMACESGAILGRAPSDAVNAMREYGWNIGLAFQIIDDILDFTGQESEMGKPVGSDLPQGALTLPVILLLERYPDDKKLRNALDGKRAEMDIKQIAEMVINSKVIDECYSIASSYSSRALQSIQPFSAANNIQPFQDMAQYILSRKK